MTYQTLSTSLPVAGHDVLISILPEHAERLYRGTKIYELRKVLPKEIPRRIFLYETNDARAITGHLVVEQALTASPRELWKTIGNNATTKDRFFGYFSGRNLAHAFQVSGVVKYTSSIPLDSVVSVERGFKVPQSFLYLKNLPSLHQLLARVAEEEALKLRVGGIALQPLRDDHRSLFLEWVNEHIGGAYLETATVYGNTLVEIHDAGCDNEGILTKRKRILEVYDCELLVGFIVLTEKEGGSIKTGPTIIAKGSRGHGVGKRLRMCVHKISHALGGRKVFCTAPSMRKDATSYLLGAGYRVEAHLRRHYHFDHDEFVFGFHLGDRRGPAPEFIRQISPIGKPVKLRQRDPEVADFIQTEFEKVYCAMPKLWGERQVKEAVAYAKGKASAFKPRMIYVARNLKVEAVALCVHKRGGSVKIILLSQTAHEKSLTSFLERTEKNLKGTKKMKVRKLYAHVPTGDVNVCNSFYAAGYSAEGVLNRPYSDYSDMMVFGKLVT